MVRKRRCSRAAAVILLLGLVLVFRPGHEAHAQAKGVIVIANSSVTDSVLDRRTLANIFLKKKTTWSNRDSIEIATLNGGDVHNQFLRDYVGKTEEQYSSHWQKLVFTGTGKPPRSFDSERELAAYVAAVKGAIGYVSSNTDISDVKRISIQD